MQVSRRPSRPSAALNDLSRLSDDLDNVLESLDIPVALLGPDLRIRRATRMNRPPLNLGSASAGRSIRDIQKKLGFPGLEEAALEVIRTGRPKEMELAARGTGRWYKLRVRPYTSGRGKAEGVVLALLDADAGKRALLQLQDVTDQCLVILDSELRVQSANPRFHEFFAVSPAKARRRRLSELGGALWGNKELDALLHGALADGTPFRFELEVRPPRRGPRLVRLGGVRVPNESLAAHTVFLSITDVTDRRRDEALKALEERERAEMEFIANVSHELRTPTTAIKGYAQTLLTGGLDEKGRADFVRTIERNADRLADLIEDLLRFGPLARPSRPRQVRLSEAVIRAAANAGSLGKVARVSVGGRVPAWLEVRADPAQLEEVLSQLLENAVKFNRRGGRVTLKARANGREALISVEDTGSGFSREDLPRLFERFYRGRAARAGRGSGLGLSIARQVVTAHGGRIWAENRPGGGAAIFFTLPLWKARERS